MLYNDFRNKIIKGKAEDVLTALPDNSIKLFVTSPPYNLRNSSGNGFKQVNNSKLWRSNKFMHGGYEDHEDNLSHEDYVSWQRECLKQMFRCLKDDGVIFYNHKWRVQEGLLQDRSDIMEGLPVRQIIIWDRGGGINHNDGYLIPSYEVIYMICKKDFKKSVRGTPYNYTDVWRINHCIDNEHPAPFPLEIPERCIRISNSDIIVDPFIGSGTSAVAAIRMGINYLGIDISQKYVDMSNENIMKEYNRDIEKMW